MLDLLSGYNWDRPLNLLSMGGDINVGLKEYLMYEGFSYKFVPIKNKMKSSEIGFADPEDLYYKMKNVYTWDALHLIIKILRIGKTDLAALHLVLYRHELV